MWQIEKRNAEKEKMIPILTTIGLIVLFWSEAKKYEKNPFKWVALGVLTFWLTSMIPSYFFIEYVIEGRTDKTGILLSILVIITFLVSGVLLTRMVYRKIKEN